MTFLALLRPIFGEKMKTAPQRKLGAEVIRPEKAFEYPLLAEKSVSISVKTFFFFFFFLEITCFWAEKAFEFPTLAEKSVSTLVKTFFFLLEITCCWAEKAFEFPEFSEKFRLKFQINRVILIQEQ